MQAAVTAIGDLDDFGREGAEAPVKYVVDADKGHGKVGGIAEAYERDGFVIVRKVLDANLLSELGQHIDWLIERHPELEPEGLGHHLIAEDPFWVRFLSDPHLLDVAETLVGLNSALFAADYTCKPPLTGKGIQWHQDAHY